MALSEYDPPCWKCAFAPHSLQECATIGGSIPICRQAQTKLEVCLYMFLWSPDTEAVLVAMSCFRHLCEEADIRSAADEVPVQTILPNYATFSELASVSNMMGTGRCCSAFVKARDTRYPIPVSGIVSVLSMIEQTLKKSCSSSTVSPGVCSV